MSCGHGLVHGPLKEFGRLSRHDAFVCHGLKNLDGHADEFEEGLYFDFTRFLVDVYEDYGGGKDGICCVIEPMLENIRSVNSLRREE